LKSLNFYRVAWFNFRFFLPQSY